MRQGEGAQADSEGSHYQKFAAIRREFRSLKEANGSLQPAFPAAVNPVLRRPPRPEGRVWIENAAAAECVDLANAAYGLMVRLIAYSYGVARPGESARRRLRHRPDEGHDVTGGARRAPARRPIESGMVMPA